MNDVNTASDVSAILDEGQAGQLSPQYRGLEAVHAALLDKRALTWSRPTPGLSERVLLRASLHRPERVRRWPVPLAASLFLGGCAALFVLRFAHPAPAPLPVQPPVVIRDPAPPAVVPALPPLNIDPGVLTRVAERSEPAFVSVEQPLIGQARAVGQDAQRGFRAVLTRLPIRVSLDVLRLL